MAGASALLNAGSRFPHTLVCACFAWSIEAVCVVATPGATPANGAKWVAGLGLGGVTALMLATRAADAAALGAGVFLYFCLALARRRMSWRGVAGAAVSFGLVAGLTLVILRLQIGEWFRTGYSLTHLFMPNNVPQWGPPQISQLNVGVPLAYGSYMWWPCAPALGAAGIALAWHGPERRVLFMLACGTLALFTLYSFSVFGRYGWDNEYGPRLQLPVVVTMAVGGGLLLAPLWERARAAARGEGGWRARLRALPALAAACAALVAVGRIAMLVYPGAHAEVHERDAILRAVKDAHLHDAIVGMQPGRTPIDMKDLAQNLPGDPAPHVLLLELHRREDVACAKSQFPDKKWYRVEGRDEVKLVAE
jgi:hypothetical protein